MNKIFEKYGWNIRNDCTFIKNINNLWTSFISFEKLDDTYTILTIGNIIDDKIIVDRFFNDKIIVDRFFNDKIIVEKSEKRKTSRLETSIETIIIDKEIYDDLEKYKVTEYETYILAIGCGWSLCDCWRSHDFYKNCHDLTTFSKNSFNIFTEREEDGYVVTLSREYKDNEYENNDCDDIQTYFEKTLSDMNGRVRDIILSSQEY